MSVFKQFKSQDVIISPFEVSKDFSFESINPSYTLSVDGTPKDEGETFIFTLNTTYVIDGTKVPFTLSGSGITTSDISPSSLVGEFEVYNSTATYSLTTLEDLTTEGDETLTLSLDNGEDSIDVVITDTSTTPLTPPTYSINSTSSVNEGEDITVTITSTEPSQTGGTTLNLTYSGTAVGADFDISLPSTVNLDSNGEASFIIGTVDNDNLESNETLIVTISGTLPNTDISNSTLSTTTIILGQDNSPEYNVTANITTASEANNDTITFTVTALDLANMGGNITYNITGTGIDNTDFVGDPSLTGTITLSSGTGSVSYTVKSDNITEGDETLTFTISGLENSQINNTPATGLHSLNSVIIDDSIFQDITLCSGIDDNDVCCNCT